MMNSVNTLAPQLGFELVPPIESEALALPLIHVG